MLVFMKVEGPGPTGKTAPAKRAAKTGNASGAGFSDALRGAPDGGGDSVDDASGLTGGAAIGSVDALLALQGVDALAAVDPDEGRRNKSAARRGEDLLDRLEAIRIGLLTGGIPRDRLEQLASALSDRGEQAADPALKAVIADIEVRVAVELAKYRRER